MEDLVLSVPLQDAVLVETLAQRMGWTMRRRRTSVDRFIRSAEKRLQDENSCSKVQQMSDDDIQAEINEYRKEA